MADTPTHLSPDEVIVLINQTDAQVWAEAFQRTFRAILAEGIQELHTRVAAAIREGQVPDEPTLTFQHIDKIAQQAIDVMLASDGPEADTGWLIGWFANAIQSGYDHRWRTFPLMTGYAIADAIDRGDMVFVQFLTDGDAAWFLADECNDDHPEGTPSSWWREHVGQIAVAAYASENVGDPVPDMEPGMWERADYEGGLDEVRPSEVRTPMSTEVTVRNVSNDGP
jgi:hypothetical protein